MVKDNTDALDLRIYTQILLTSLSRSSSSRISALDFRFSCIASSWSIYNKIEPLKIELLLKAGAFNLRWSRSGFVMEKEDDKEINGEKGSTP
ncbi:hypothetical protein E3N88_15177 [Mikania micrantha]|uniref:Uncharacterized protein n=1 Tax=Mikania micrantha TaxID=192012 RepID=A0A5N6NW34_9ASTR|nr:hypothetical protein E3N88_15177 [Mikania micrantha]